MLLRKASIHLNLFLIWVFFYWPELVEGNIVEKYIWGFDTLIFPFVASICCLISFSAFNSLRINKNSLHFTILWNLLVYVSFIWYPMNSKLYEYLVIFNYIYIAALLLGSSVMLNQKLLVNSLIVFSTFYLSLSVIYYDADSGLSGALGDGYHRLGRTASTFAIVMLCDFLSRNTKRRLISLLGFLLGIVTMIISAHRMAIVVFFVLGIYILFRLGWLLRGVLISAMAVSAFLPIFLSLPKVVYLINRFVYLPSTNGSSERLMFYERSLELIISNPLTGYGFGRFPVVSGLLAYRHPHNLFLETWLELGIVGLLILIMIMRIVGLKLFDFKLKLIVYSYLLHSMVSGSITDNRMLFFFLFLILFMKNEIHTSIKLQT